MQIYRKFFFLVASNPSLKAGVALCVPLPLRGRGNEGERLYKKKSLLLLTYKRFTKRR
jgi:hypothetical protein